VRYFQIKQSINFRFLAPRTLTHLTLFLCYFHPHILFFQEHIFLWNCVKSTVMSKSYQNLWSTSVGSSFLSRQKQKNRMACPSSRHSTEATITVVIRDTTNEHENEPFNEFATVSHLWHWQSNGGFQERVVTICRQSQSIIQQQLACQPNPCQAIP
jgi:hypothetical protein